jgi:hypothetical protein
MINNKKRAIDDREGLGSDGEEVEDLRAVEDLSGSRKKGRNIVQITVSVEYTTPCATNTPEGT